MGEKFPTFEDKRILIQMYENVLTFAFPSYLWDPEDEQNNLSVDLKRRVISRSSF